MRFINKFPNKKYVIKPITIIEVGGRPVTQPGKSVEFSNGELNTDDKEVISYLKKHQDFGISMFTDEPKKTDKSDDTKKSGDKKPDDENGQNQ